MGEHRFSVSEQLHYYLHSHKDDDGFAKWHWLLTTTHFLQWSNLKFTLCAETSVQKYTLRITEYYMEINTTW